MPLKIYHARLPAKITHRGRQIHLHSLLSQHHFWTGLTRVSPQPMVKSASETNKNAAELRRQTHVAQKWVGNIVIHSNIWVWWVKNGWKTAGWRDLLLNSLAWCEGPSICTEIMVFGNKNKVWLFNVQQIFDWNARHPVCIQPDFARRYWLGEAQRLPELIWTI